MACSGTAFLYNYDTFAGNTHKQPLAYLSVQPALSLERFFHRRFISLLVLYVQHYWTLLKDDVCLCRNLQSKVHYDSRDYETLKKTIYLEAREEIREGNLLSLSAGIVVWIPR
jgi:hypothetical protein